MVFLKMIRTSRSCKRWLLDLSSWYTGTYSGSMLAIDVRPFRPLILNL